MDFFFCIPIIFGCDPKVSQEGDGTPHICPRCHNAQVVTAKSRRIFSICWIPLIPMKAKHIYVCGICQWQMEQGGSYVPPVAGAGQQGYGGGMQPYGGNGYPPK